VADKLTQQIIESLTKAAAEHSGLPLYAVKTDPGLFMSTAAGKSAAQKCLTDGFLRVVGSNTRSKTPRELYGLTEKGWNFLLTQVNPKQVLEDFVRVLEAQRGEVGELLDTAQRMAENLQGLKDAVIRILPSVIEGRVLQPESGPHPPTPSAVGPHPPTPSHRLPLSPGERGLGGEGRLASDDVVATTAILDAPPIDLASTILACLGDWPGAAGEDCPLPKL
jgi:hypothetical protein